MIVIGLGQRAAGDDGVGPVIVDGLRAIGRPDLALLEVAEPSGLISLLATSEPVVIVDAVVDGESEGELVELAELPRGMRTVSTHGIDLGQAVALAGLLAGAPHIHFVGVTIACTSGAYLSAAVAAAVPRAIERILELATAGCSRCCRTAGSPSDARCRRSTARSAHRSRPRRRRRTGATSRP